MHRNSRAVTGLSTTTRIDTRSELLRPVSESPMTVGTRVFILSRTGEKKIVAEGLLLCPLAPGYIFSIVKVFVTSTLVSETPLILLTIAEVTTICEVVGEDPIEWNYKDFMRHP
ncbi:uncharacterized protein LOC127263972 [Andrographis paniculata]|uniref:uncharacterized protein LOC127263972 n=1 Tax=Andrographis paniculata TaxID=175694 RepID=UPI0021E85B1D|nr:uncharacterized protein LOC127263972 [Andrographis paniculata]